MGNCRSSPPLVIPRKPNPVVYTKQQRTWLWATPAPALDLHFRLEFRRWHLSARLMHGEAIHLCLQKQFLTNINAHVYSWQLLLLQLLSKHSQVQQTSDWKLELVQLPVGDVYSNWLWYITARASVQSSWSPLGEGNKKKKDLRQGSVAFQLITVQLILKKTWFFIQ